jgi:hypothetical protein
MAICPACFHSTGDEPPLGQCVECGTRFDPLDGIDLPVRPARRGAVADAHDDGPDLPDALGTIGLPFRFAGFTPRDTADLPRPRSRPLTWDTDDRLSRAAAEGPAGPLSRIWDNPGPPSPEPLEAFRGEAREPRVRLLLQVRRDGRWIPLTGPLGPRGVAVARRGRPEPVWLARVVPDGEGVRVVDLGGGVHQQLRGPVALADGDRLRIGRQTLVFRAAARPGEAWPWRSRVALVPIGPHGPSGPAFALDAPEVVVGRDPGPQGLALADDPLVSARHLAVRRDGWGVVAEDLGSRNGSFLLRPGGFVAPPGEGFLIGDRCFRAAVAHADAVTRTEMD